MKAKLVLALSGLLAASPSLAQDSVAEFYKKNSQIRLMTGADVGGGYDGYSRLLARHIGRFIPGNPTVIVQNMPGAAGIAATNWLYNVAPKDGTAIAMPQRLVPFLQIMGEDGPKFETEKFNWLGSLASEVNVCVAWKASTDIRTFADLQKKELILGGSGANDTETVPALLNNVLGAKFKIVSGYRSQSDINLAVERGEVHAACPSYSSLMGRTDWIKAGKAIILVQSSTQKHPDLPNVPLALELAKNPEDKALLEFNDARLSIGRPFALPPGVPAERVKALRAAFMQMVKDKDFLADVAKEKRELDVVSGDDMQALFERLAKTPKSLVERLASEIKYKGTVVQAKVDAPAGISGVISEIENDGAKITIKLPDGKTYTTSISGSRTNLQIAGQKGDRKDLKIGQACELSAPGDGQEASAVSCK
jgi:tripartite-type tricarboxylate transporter receptor subunit TctC